jgi:hypothetical protein
VFYESGGGVVVAFRRVGDYADWSLSRGIGEGDMTEEEWMVCDEPGAMNRFLRQRGSDRKLRLFACGCCRLLGSLLDDPLSLQALDVAEQFADNRATATALAEASHLAYKARYKGNRKQANTQARFAALHTTYKTQSALRAVEYSAEAAGWAGRDSCASSNLRSKAADRAADEARRAHEARQVTLLRCVFGNPFRVASLDTVWLTSTVVALTKTAYEERALPEGHLDSDRLAILADALEDAGCTNADLLGHLRSPGPHVRGCWAVDLLLAKE